MGLSDEEKAAHRLEHMVFVKEQILGKGNVKMCNDYYELIQELIAVNKHDYAIAQLNTLLTIEEKAHGANSKECIEIIMQKGQQWFCLEQWEKAFQEYVEACARLRIPTESQPVRQYDHVVSLDSTGLSY